MTQRPQTLADVAFRGGASVDGYSFALAEFLDDFYLDASMIGREQRIAEPPALSHLTPDTVVLIAAAAEHLAQRWGICCPEWVGHDEFLGDGKARFFPDSPRIRPMLLVESPPAFRRRMIFTVAEPLGRARLPGGYQVIMPFEKDH